MKQINETNILFNQNSLYSFLPGSLCQNYMSVTQYLLKKNSFGSFFKYDLPDEIIERHHNINYNI